MEDMFEALLGLAVILIPLLLKKDKKKKNKEKPGNPTEAPKKQKKQPEKPEFNWKEAFDEVEKKLNDVFDELDETDEIPQPIEPKPKMQPQVLQPEPMIPPMLQEQDMGEGVSRTDDEGCIGGSLPHAEEEFHQGADFHSHEEHSFARKTEPQPAMRVERVKPQISAAELRKAVLWKEILDRPVSMRE